MRIFRLIPAIILAAIIFLSVASAAPLVAAQATQNTTTPHVTTEWTQHYSYGSAAWALDKTKDGGYILAGYSNKTSRLGNDGWYAKVDAEGKVQWQYVTNRTGNETLYAVQQTSDGRFILAGYSTSSQGQHQAYLLKIYEDGKQVEWVRNFSGKGIAVAHDVKQTNAGGYVIVGQTKTVNGTGTAFLIITDASGNQQGTMKEFESGSSALALEVTKDGGYIIVGWLDTSYGSQLYLIKTDQNGNVLWQESYGQGGYETGYGVLQTKDGGYVCAGKQDAYGKGGYDALLLKTDASGKKEWEQSYGSTTDDAAYSVQQTNDGGYILAGSTDLEGGNPTIYKSDANGNYTWDVYWGSIQGAAWGVLQTKEGNFVIAGPDYDQDSPFLLKTTAERAGSGADFPFSNGSNLDMTWALGVAIILGAIGVVGTYYARRAKKGGHSLGGGGPATRYGKIGETTNVDEKIGGATTAGAVTVGAMQTQPETQPAEQRGLSSPQSFPNELGSRFSQTRYLGEGGFARVFSALNLKGAPVAVKVLKSRDPKAGKLFTTEAAIWSVLRHENIVRLFDYNIFPIPYLESELCDSSVESEMSYGPLPVERAIELTKQIATGLSYAHQRRILHSDIKPSNILIKDHKAKISDWGLSKLKTEPSVSVAGVTLQYAAPEQLSREFGGADERTDIYQLGVLLYQCIAGTLPFADAGSLVDTILRDEPTPPSQFRQISTKLDDIILKCLKKRKGERYQSADELVRELDAVAS